MSERTLDIWLVGDDAHEAGEAVGNLFAQLLIGEVRLSRTSDNRPQASFCTAERTFELGIEPFLTTDFPGLDSDISTCLP